MYNFHLGRCLSSVSPNGPDPHNDVERPEWYVVALFIFLQGYRFGRIQIHQTISDYTDIKEKVEVHNLKLAYSKIAIGSNLCRIHEAALHMSPPSVDAYSTAAKVNPKGFDWIFFPQSDPKTR